ncbi:MAG: hypothetical protein HYZ38_15935 [Mycobacterium sp.]|nr:hypothetical protein [Mycobacterium sp.]
MSCHSGLFQQQPRTYNGAVGPEVMAVMTMALRSPTIPAELLAILFEHGREAMLTHSVELCDLIETAWLPVTGGDQLIKDRHHATELVADLSVTFLLRQSALFFSLAVGAPLLPAPLIAIVTWMHRYLLAAWRAVRLYD